MKKRQINRFAQDDQEMSGIWGNLHDENKTKEAMKVLGKQGKGSKGRNSNGG